MSGATEISLIQESEETGAEQLLARVDLPQSSGKPLYGAVMGVLTGVNPEGQPLVDFPENQLEPLPARACASFSAQDVGRDVTLLFEGGNPHKPILMGLIQKVGEKAGSPSATLDGERLVFSAEREIVLRCGKASITLTKAGKVLIRGSYLLNRSSGVNRIKGGSVQIN